MKPDTESSSSIVVVAGPNGAGKSTTAEALLKGTLAVEEFVNADVIARGLSGFAPEGSAFAAGRIMLGRMRELSEQGATFAFETTLASRSLALWLDLVGSCGYLIHILYLWLPSPELAVLRVQQRVRAGGHSVPEDVIRRRYWRSLVNFFEIYRPLATSWHVYDNASPVGARLIARGRAGVADEVIDASLWREIEARGRGQDAR